MPQVQLNEDVFRTAQQRATAGGFASVDEYVSDVLLHDGVDVAADVVSRFTPDRLARIDAAAADVRAGRHLTAEQADAALADRRDAWVKANAR